MKKRVCPNCGCEVFKQDSVFIRTCPQCDNRHDFDDSRCPVCGYEY